MINLYSGRVIIERRKLSENWSAKFKVPKRPELTIDLCTPDIREAYIRAQYHYLALHQNQPVEQVEEELKGQVKCWSCIHWLPRKDECSFGFPEARQNRGRFAARCGLYENGTESPSTDGSR